MSVFSENEEKKIVFLLFLIFFILRLFIFLISDDNDALGDVIHAIRPGWSIVTFVSHHTPPLGIYLVKIARMFSESPMAARIPNLILGSLLAVPLYYLVKILYDQETALFCSLALGVFYRHINMSVLPSAEIPLYFFAFTALYFLSRFMQSDDKSMTFFILSAICLNLATMSRYESWLLVPILPLFLIKRKKKYAFAFFLLSMVFPAFWMYLNYKLSGNPINFYFIQSAKLVKKEIMDSLGPDLSLAARSLGWFKMLQFIFSAPLFWLGLFGLFYSIFKRKFMLPIIFLCVVSSLTLRLINLTIPLGPRYAMFPSLFFIIFIIFGLNSFKKAKRVAFYCLALILPILWIPQAINERPLFAPSHRKILNYLKNNLQHRESVAVVGGAYDMLYKNLSSQRLHNQVDNIGTCLTETGELEVDIGWLCDYAKSHKPRYFVIDNASSSLAGLPDIKKILTCFPGASAQRIQEIEGRVGGIYRITYDAAL